MSGVPFEQQRSVWTYNHSTEWLAKNGAADMLLVTGLSDQQADTLCTRLLELMPTQEFEVWDIHNNSLREYKSAPRRIGPARRKLGSRG